MDDHTFVPTKEIMLELMAINEKDDLDFEAETESFYTTTGGLQVEFSFPRSCPALTIILEIEPNSDALFKYHAITSTNDASTHVGVFDSFRAAYLSV